MTSHVSIIIDQLTWAGTQEIGYYKTPNIWIGPQQEKLVNLGAMFAPCMRAEKFLVAEITNYQLQTELGCCIAAGVGTGTICSYFKP